MLAMIYRVLGLVMLLFVALACWIVIAVLIVVGARIAGFWSPLDQIPGSFVPGIAIACIGWYYIDLCSMLIRSSMVISIRTCLHEILMQSVCLLWFPTGMTVVPVACRSILGIQGPLTGAFIVGGVLAWGLVRLTQTARFRPESTNDDLTSSEFGGRPRIRPDQKSQV